MKEDKCRHIKAGEKKHLLNWTELNWTELNWASPPVEWSFLQHIESSCACPNHIFLFRKHWKVFCHVKIKLKERELRSLTECRRVHWQVPDCRQPRRSETSTPISRFQPLSLLCSQLCILSHAMARFWSACLLWVRRKGETKLTSGLNLESYDYCFVFFTQSLCS